RRSEHKTRHDDAEDEYAWLEQHGNLYASAVESFTGGVPSGRSGARRCVEVRFCRTASIQAPSTQAHDDLGDDNRDDVSRSESRLIRVEAVLRHGPPLVVFTSASQE